MPNRNRDLYQQAIEAFNQGGVDAVLPFFDERVELYDPDLPAGTAYEGHEGVRRFIDQMLEGFEQVLVRAEGLIEAGDRVIGLIRWGGGGGGVEVEIRDAHTWTFRDGKIVYWRPYLDRMEALADAGLDPSLADGLAG